MEQEIVKAIEHWKNRTGYDTFNLRAALFDMDGTLYNSMPNHTMSWYQLMTAQGVECTRDEFYLYEGMTGAQTITHLWQRQWGKTPSPQLTKELYHKKTEIFNQLDPVYPMPGALEVVQGLLNRGIITVLVTGSGQPSILNRLATEFPGAFDEQHRVTALNVSHGKPHPEPYLKGMQLAGVRPYEAVAIENAPIGVQSAVASGALTIAITTGPIPAQSLADAGADLVLPSMDGLRTIMPLIH